MYYSDFNSFCFKCLINNQMIFNVLIIAVSSNFVFCFDIHLKHVFSFVFMENTSVYFASNFRKWFINIKCFPLLVEKHVMFINHVFKVSLEKRVFQCFFQLHPNMFLLKHIVFIRKTHPSYYKTLAYIRENTKRLCGKRSNMFITNKKNPITRF